MENKMSQTYGLRVATIEVAIHQLSEDIEYLCSIIESPHPDFVVKDAVAYSLALASLLRHLSFAEDLAEKNEQSTDGVYIKVNNEELLMMQECTKESETTLLHLEETCGISLQKN